MRAMMMVAVGLLLGACGPGGGGGGGDGLPWIPCSEIEGEAPCCPRIDVEALCTGEGETFEPPVEGVSSARCFDASGAQMLSAGGFDFVQAVNTGDTRLGWRGRMLCGEDGRVIRYVAQAADGLHLCKAACFNGCTDIECPELDPFPLSPDGYASGPPPPD